ncbi:uncharacterized protein LOC143904856 [Temnothorax americanus]|uniref:uncharacterized protein LOC143904856 n=1 Tax=Temnothorax americanus TaxID=1964332 RepID=UPI0040682864
MNWKRKEYASSVKSSKRPRASINTGQKKTDLSMKVQRKKLRFNRANDGHAPTVEIDLPKVMTKTPTFLENDSTRSFVNESVLLWILPLNMAKIELEKAKAIALSPAADNKQIGQDVDLTCSNKSSLTIQSVCLSEILPSNTTDSELKEAEANKLLSEENNKLTGTTVDYTCSNEPQLAAQSKRNDDVFSPELLSQTPTFLENVGTLCLVEEIVHLSKTLPANNASEESSQTEECEMFPATDN